MYNIVHTYIHTHEHIYNTVHTYMYTHVYMYIHTCIYTYIYICMYKHTYIFIPRYGDVDSIGSFYSVSDRVVIVGSHVRWFPDFWGLRSGPLTVGSSHVDLKLLRYAL